MAENWVSENRDVSDFNRVSVHDAGELIITQGSEETLLIEANADVLDRVTSEVCDGELRLGLKGWLDRLISWPQNIKIRYTLTLKELKGLNVSGACTVVAGSLTGQSLDISTSGSAKVNIDELTAETLKVDISGSGDFAIAGRIQEQQVHVSGAGDYRASGLESKSARLNLSGSSRVHLWVSDTLDVHISGMGTVEYTGSPKVSQHISGMGKVRQVEG
jgi:hypothetical protein